MKVGEGHSIFVFFLCEIGGPGSGKVSHSQRLSQDSQGQILHLNVIDLLKSTFGLTSKMKWIMYYDTAWYSLCWRRRRHHNAQERKHSITRNRESHFWYSESCQVVIDLILKTFANKDLVKIVAALDTTKASKKAKWKWKHDSILCWIKNLLNL